MSDVQLSVEVLARMDALSAGLKTGNGYIDQFVAKGNASIKDFEKTLNSLGVGMSGQGIKGLSDAIAAQRLETEKQRTALLGYKAANEAAKLSAIDAAGALNQQKAATEANRTATEAQKAATERAKGAAEANRAATERAREATQQHTAALLQQKAATEAQRTANAALLAEINALRLANMQNRGAVVAAAGSYDEARQRLVALGREIRAAAGGFNSTNPIIRGQIQAYTELNRRIQEYNAQMLNHQGNVGNYGSALGALRSQLMGVAATYVSVFAAIAAVNRVISSNTDVSDLFADIQRTAGLSAVEVDRLTDSLKQLDTRTSLQGLLKITVIGGQLGIAKSQLVGFTTAVDQLSVALSGELDGGPEGVAKSLGILNKVFKISQKDGGDVEKAFNRIGSTILGLGQSGLATGEFLTDFGQRVGGIAAQARLSLPVLLSYGAVLQEQGVTAEVAGTSFKKLLTSLSIKRDKFLAVAQIADSSLTLEKFTDVLNNDTQKALSLFFDGLAKGGPKTTQFIDLLKSVGLTGAYASQSVSALALNQGDLNKHIQEATVDFNDASKAAEQFALKNDTLGGSLDKLGNTLTNFFTNPNSNFMKGFKFVIDATTDAIVAIDKLIDKTKELRTVEDKRIVEGAKGNYNALLGPEELEKIRAAKQRLTDANTRRMADDLIGRASASAKIAISNLKDEAQFTRFLANEKDKLQKSAERLNYTEAFIRDPKNVGAPLDAQIQKVNKLRFAYQEQRVKVAELNKEYSNLYGKPTTKGEGVDLDNTKPDKKGERAYDSMQKQLQDFMNKSNIITKEGLEKDLQEWDDKYAKIKAVIAKLPAGDRKTTATATLETNYKEGRSNFIEANSIKVQEALKKNQDAIALTMLAGDAKEMEAVRLKYAELLKLAKGNAAAIAEVKKAQGEEETALIERQGARDANLITKQIADIAKEYRNHKAEMFILGKTKGALAVEVAENEKAKSDLKKQWDDQLVSFEAYQNKMADLIKKGNELEIKPPVFDVKHFLDVAKAAQESINALLTDFVDSKIYSALSAGFEGIGAALVNGGNVLEAAGKAVISTISGFIGEMGALLMKKGAATVLAGVAMNLILPGSGAKQIAGGFALIAAGAGMSVGGGVLGAVGSSGGSSGKSPGGNLPQFAMGVENFGGGLALVGERGPEIVNLPTGSDVIPNHKVMQSIAGAGSTQVMIPEVRLSGQDLYISFKRTEKNNKRG